MKICLECEGITDAQQADCASCGTPLSETRAVHFPLRRGEADAANPLLGTTIDGKYLVQGVLGKGGMGTVFRATHRVSLVPVALKVLHPRFSGRREYREYFLAEAQKAGRVVHEHAGRILDVGEADDGTVYIAMEEVSGVTLHECIHGAEPLAPAIVVDILAQICQALIAAHGAGLVHRDLTPRNVMVIARAGAPFIKILDFGIAKGLPRGRVESRRAETVDQAPPSEPAMFANPPYSAPEHLEGQDVDARCDLYSLGVIAYEALTRTLPVDSGTRKEMATATLNGELSPMPARSGVPSRLARLVTELLARDPGRRPASAEAVLRALDDIQQPGSRLRRDLAVMVLFLGLVVLGFSYLDQAEPRLEWRQGSRRLRVVGLKDALPAPQHFQSSELDQIKFGFAGFRAARLTVEIKSQSDQDTGWQGPPGLGAVTDKQGLLVLNRRDNPHYRRLLEQLATMRGPVELTFLVPGQRPLGQTLLVVDDEPPRLGMQVLGGRDRSLSSASQIVITFEDGVKRDSFGAVVLTAQIGDDRALFEIDSDDLGKKLDCAKLLGELQEGVEPRPGVTLLLNGQDRAENVARERVLGFRWLDFRVPQFRSPAKIPVLESAAGDRAALSLQLDAAEEGLQVLVRRWDQEEFSAIAKVAAIGTQLNLELAKADLGGFTDGRYEFAIQDQAGNRQRLECELSFHPRTADFELSDPDRVATRLQALHDYGLVWLGQPMAFSFGCNPYYRPTAVQLRDVDEATDQTLELTAAAAGRGTITLPDHTSSPNGEYHLIVTLQPAVRQPGSLDAPGVPFPPWKLRLLAKPVTLRVLGTTGLRYFHEFVGDNGPLEVIADSPPVVRPTARWPLAPDDLRLLRGDVIWLPGDAEPDVEPLVRGAGRQPFIGPRPVAQLHAGRNQLCLRLRDLFDRPVRVFVGASRAPIVPATRLRDGAVRVFEFQHFADPEVQLTKPLILEYGQDTRFVIRSRFAFDPSKDQGKIQVTLDGVRSDVVQCTAIEVLVGGGSELTFELGFARMAHVIDVDSRADTLREGGLDYPMTLRLETPAFEPAELPVVVNNIRSSLIADVLGRWFDAVAKPLRGIRMVPVLRPIGDAFPDPVSADLRAAGRFIRRQEIPVSNLHDFYLQARELSRGQYAQIVAQYQLRLATGAIVHHPADPLGAARPNPQNMAPLSFGGPRDRRLTGLREEDPAAPVTGVNFFQAFAVARMAGVVIDRDPEMFRLPLGVELAVAALLGKPKGSLNGLAGRQTLLNVRRLGDVVDTSKGAFRGLDFGVWEWVLDLPWPAPDGPRATVAAYLGDYEKHLAQSFGIGDQSGLSASQRVELMRIGVVRGGDLADPVADLVGLWRRRKPLEAHHKLPIGVPGVVTSVHVRRDGEGLVGLDRRLARIGLRLAGGDAFVAKVRIQ